MAASKASPSITTTVSVSSSTSSTSITNNTSLTTTTTILAATPDICHNFHELCRSCGKTNDQLYDLFQSPQSSSSPFNTSSTTCYTHLNNSCSSSSSLVTATNKTSTTAVGSCTKTAATLDTIAATAKASAKGQSNMDNILQEMQIWQLMIKCNDGLPQRICAKCTAQFYMIHKFRRKCLKVQTQLRALNEEQKIYERQQESKEKNETETGRSETEAIAVAIEQPEPTLLAEAVKPCELLKNQDFVNDKPSEQEQQQQEAALIQTKSSSSVSFETIAGNTNKVCKVATLLDNNAVETMPKQKTPTSSALAVNDKTFETHDQGTLTHLKLKDEKKPLLKAAVLNSIRPSGLTLQQPLEQICDNEATEGGDALANVSKKLCLDQEDLLAAHVIFKTSSPTKINDLKQCTESDKEKPNISSTELKRKTPELKLTQNSAFSKAHTESLFITKAALKAYTIPTTRTTESSLQNVTNSEAKSNNDNNNNAHLCDNHSELNDNTCSSTSSSSTPSSSSSCNSKSSSSSTNPFRTKILRHKIVKYAAYSSRRSGYCFKSKKPSLNQSGIIDGKRKQRSWQNKHKLKRLNAMRTCASSASQAAQKLRQQEKEHKQKVKNLQMEDETSSTVPTISSTTSSSSSLTTTTAIATTPAVSNLVGGNHENIQSSLYYKNAIETGCPSIEGISSNKSCLMWKTKAAMKANANDMPQDIVRVQDNVKAFGNITEISLPHTATETPITGSACLATETDTSSKTLNENQSGISSISNNILIEEYCLTNKALNSTDNQVKDTEDESTPNLNNNLWSEEADQKQIKANKPNENAINEKSPKEFINCNTSEEDEEKPKELEENHEEPQKAAVVLTPPAKVGCMKLIIQRKRGARFKCRRKVDDDEISNTQDNLEPTTPKRRKKTSNANLKTKLEMESIFSSQHKENDELKITNEDTVKEEEVRESNIISNKNRKVPEFNSEEDENKENPIDLDNHHDFDSDSNVSVYRDPLLTRNEIVEDDTHLTDFPKPQLSLQTECSKEMYKLYKEKANLESPKKLIVRVPLTSLTQDFKRMHLTMDQEDQEDQENEMENGNPQQEHPNQSQQELNEQETKEPTFSLQNFTENEDELSCNQLNSTQTNISSGQSDLLGFSQNTEASSSTVDSSQKSMEMVKYVEPPLCSASSKINDFINDFQNNCIDSSEIDESCDMVPHLGPQINQELSDEIRDVEDTLNGILSEMHDKDMYNHRSGETDEFFAQSVYSPLTDSPTTPTHSFYAESPCTINSNPMSVSPFIHQNMDYNAMTPQSNHSSMGHSSHMGSGSGGSTSSHAGVFSEHFPTYNECFEETTQSELIGFQNDIPCFENIENNNPGNNNEFLGNQEEFNEQEEVNHLPTARNANTSQNNVTGNVEVQAGEEIVDYIDLSDYKENSQDYVATHATQVPVETGSQQQASSTEVFPNQVTYQAATYQPSTQMQNTNNNMTTQPHYIVTNTNQGPILIANPHLNQTAEQMEPSFKPHSNNLQFVTLGQAMEAPNRTPSNHLTEINWPPTVNTPSNYNQQPVISTSNSGTTTYFINANGELYQASIPTTTLQNPTIIVPTANTNQTFNKANMDNNDNYMQQQQQPQHQNNGQYIMLVNNLGGTPQYYATTHASLNQTVQTPTTSTVLFHPNQTRQLQNGPNYLTNAPKQNHNTTTETNSTKTTLVPITPNLEPSTQTMHQRINQQLQRQIKQRQLQLLQPRSPNVTQKITLICRFCHKRPKFTNNVDYSNHIINTHPAEKPYNCPHCPMHFTRRFERQQHVAQVHGSRYQCAQCGLSFCAQRTLDFHLQKYHANLGRSHQQQHLQQNSTSTTTTPAAATYQLLQHNQQQRLVRVEDVHVQVTGENKNKRSIDLTLDSDADIQTSQSIPEIDLLSASPGIQQQQQQQALKLGCPDCNGDNDDCCGSNKNHDQQHNNSNIQQEVNLQQQQQQQYAGNESVNNHQQHPQHITIPSPEQTEPDSTTTLRHFRKRQLSDLTPHFATSPSSSSSSSLNNNIISNNHAATNNNDNLNHNSPDDDLADDFGSGVRRDNGGEQIMVERSLRCTHNCLLCEESFTNEIALRKHHHLAHGATQSTVNMTATSSALVCTICKRSFRMRNALQRHMETHDAEGRPYECNICQVRFPRPSQLTLHKLTVHKFEKPISCEECGKQFGTESAMKAHAKEHEEAASLITASSASDTSTLSSSSSSSPPSEISSRIYLEAISTSNSSSTTITNEQNINLQSTTSGEVCSSVSNAITTNDNNTVAVYNVATQNTIVSGLSI